MFLLCGPETYDPDGLKAGLEIDRDETRRFRERFEAILRDKPLTVEEYEKDIGFHFENDEEMYRYLRAMFSFLFEDGPFPE
ncbi:MAG: hypothetical protein R3E44_06990 [Paracoccaceae bacterium]